MEVAEVAIIEVILMGGMSTTTGVEIGEDHLIAEVMDTKGLTVMVAV